CLGRSSFVVAVPRAGQGRIARVSCCCPSFLFSERDVASSRSCTPSVWDGAAHTPYRDDRGRGYTTAGLNTA
ncbi:hypothetical protein LINGRAHAP2_LOCUS35164, partial [Linum grandiflorum]